ncbi:VENN motif pre-toxin domain-containing protein, partial [Edaphovirga cremea]|uniref:VENN motif pre-toxin domain-containing protein n=1 Tax=Edaphovirga cremea TaxID=2267246 RepID=UPI00398A06EE
TKAANEKMQNVRPEDRTAAEAQWRKDNPGKEPTAENINNQIYQTAYNKAFSDSDYGTGGKFQMAVQAATAAVQGLAGGNMAQALSGAAAPYLAEQIHKLTDGNLAAQAMAHAVVGAVVAQASGNSALAGAAGAVSGELMAQLVMEQLYPGKEVSDLSESEKQTISMLGTLAAGLAGGLTGDSSAAAVAGAQAGQNAVENNTLGNGDTEMVDLMVCQLTGSQTACERANPTPEQYATGAIVSLVSIGGIAIAGATPELIAAAKAVLAGCTANSIYCLNQAGILTAEIVVPGGVGAGGGAIVIGKTATELNAAKNVVSNAAHNAASYAGLKMDLKTTQAANEAIESLRATGNLPSNYVSKMNAYASGWSEGKAVNNYVPGGQIGGDVFRNSDGLLPSAPGRTWFEADIGLSNTMSRSNPSQPASRLLYSSDGLLYVTPDHYGSFIPVGTWK